MDQRDEQKTVRVSEAVKSVEGSCNTNGSPSLPVKGTSTKLSLAAYTRTSQGCNMHACDLLSTTFAPNSHPYLLQCPSLQTNRFSTATSLPRPMQYRSKRSHSWYVQYLGGSRARGRGVQERLWWPCRSYLTHLVSFSLITCNCSLNLL